MSLLCAKLIAWPLHGDSNGGIQRAFKNARVGRSGLALDIGKVRFPSQPDWTGVLGLARVKAIQIHNFGPCIDEVAYELL
jgi:hypothetical protein